MNERLCIEEVGVDLELCVHAHGHDVDLIMEAPRKDNYSLLQDAANATLRSETLRRNCVRCHNRKRWCKKPVKKGAKRLRWRMHQTRFRF